VTDDAPAAKKTSSGGFGWRESFGLVTVFDHRFHCCNRLDSCFSGRGGSAADHHVGQSKERVKLMPILGQSAIPHFPMPKQILHDVKRMFHKRSHGRFGFLHGLDRFFLHALGQRFDSTTFARDLPVYLPCQRHELRPHLVTGFAGYAFCKAHSTAYGVEAYQSAWLKRYFPAEFMAAVLSNGKGFYHPLVYVLESHRLGLKLLSPSVNEPGPAFVPHSNSIRVPLTRVKGLTARTTEAMIAAREQVVISSLADFFRRIGPAADELEAMIRAGAFDEFGETRTRQFWQAQHLLKAFGTGRQSKQGWLIAPPGLEQLPAMPLNEPTRRDCLEWETDLFGFAVSGHPLDLFADVAWDTYCPVNRLGEFIGETVTLCGLVVEQRTHHQITGEAMKFLSLADRTGIVETELFAQTYRSYGLATVR
jgi:hypothetical protein